ncbi:MAG: hypothetical protein ACOX1Y_12950 [Zhaonellaceae bacterium]
MDRKKELKMQYKQMKPEMGIIMVRAKSGNKYFLQGNSKLKRFYQQNKILVRFRQTTCFFMRVRPAKLDHTCR